MEDITVDLAIKYCNAYSDDSELLDLMIKASNKYVENYIGKLGVSSDDLKIARLALISDMYDNRSLTIDNKQANKIVESILGFYDCNLI